MKQEDLIDIIRDMYVGSPEVDSIDSLQHSLEESERYVNGNSKNVPSLEAIRKACETLVGDGTLQRAGREGYEATEAFMEEHL